MECLAQIGVLASNSGHAGRQLRIDESAENGNYTTRHPHPENQNRSMQLLRNDVRIDENAGADNAAHNDHGGVEQAHLAQECRRGSR